jgi:hypothetical protein
MYVYSKFFQIILPLTLLLCGIILFAKFPQFETLLCVGDEEIMKLYIFNS